uniref:Uncharacterized protein n=1 Tax=viral metagenome TaxID=1070528 RepID=A0A6M3KAP3_9ZZZZ
MAEQDERLRKGVTELVQRACSKYEGANNLRLLIKVHVDEILSLLKAEIGQERKRIYEWGNKACPHAGSVAGEPLLHKHDCYVCWEELKQ